MAQNVQLLPGFFYMALAARVTLEYVTAFCFNGI